MTAAVRRAKLDALDKKERDSMNAVAKQTRPAAGGSTQEPAAELRLPLSMTQLHAGLAPIYHAAVGGVAHGEVLQMLCQQLARGLDASLVVLGRKLDSGAVALEASSSEGAALWLELHRIQERWDGGLASRGPAGRALRGEAPLALPFSHDDLAMWRAAAERDRAADALACAIPAPPEIYVLEIFRKAGSAQGAGVERIRVGALVEALAGLLGDLARIDHQRLLSQALEAAGNAGFITDAHGTIVWSNPEFSRLSGYSADEVRGRNPSLLHSGRQGLRYYRELWSRIHAGEVWSGETVDRRKSGELYTVHQTISPILRHGRVTHYLSLNEDIGRERRRRVALELASGIDRRTGLHTPAAFEAAARDMLATEAARRAGAALVVVSLRGLHRAAPSLHPDAEQFLAEIMGRRVRETIPEGQPAAALGPYEYAALLCLDQLPGRSADGLLAQLAQLLAEPVLYLGDSLLAEPRCGQARFPEQGESYEELLLRADRALANEPLAPSPHLAPGR